MRLIESQSPYGAKWFATELVFALNPYRLESVAIPLRG